MGRVGKLHNVEHPRLSSGLSRFEPGMVCLFQKGGILSECCQLAPISAEKATGSSMTVHALSCLCNNACKRSLTVCRKSRALCTVSRLLSVPI